MPGNRTCSASVHRAGIQLFARRIDSDFQSLESGEAFTPAERAETAACAEQTDFSARSLVYRYECATPNRIKAAEDAVQRAGTRGFTGEQRLRNSSSRPGLGRGRRSMRANRIRFPADDGSRCLPAMEERLSGPAGRVITGGKGSSGSTKSRRW
jgi:hypothetical protein